MMNMKRLGLFLALLILLGSSVASAQYLRVYYPDIEQGSATVVVSPSGQALLVDAGSGLNPADDDIVEFIRDLQNRGIVTSLDFIIATHYDEDHIGRLENVMQFGVAPPTLMIYDRGVTDTPNTFAYADYSFAAGLFTRQTITANTTINLGSGVTVQSLTVNGELPNGTSVDLTGTDQQENARSVSMVVTFGDVDIWIGGDLTGNPLKNVANVEEPTSTFAGDVDVYTFNHHGSDTSSNANFLAILKAEVGITQQSASNNFGHPRLDVVNRFLATPDSNGNTPLFFQQNPGNPTDTRSDDSLADGISDPDDIDEAFGLPGTLTLLSDGTSYQLYGGNVTPVKLPADAGIGTLGDYPPAILKVERSPLVPFASETVSVTAEIHDEGAITAQLVYELDGILQSPIALTSLGSNLYQANLPAQADGSKVVFWVEATDSVTQTESSVASGYFSGITPIASLRMNDSDGLLIPMRFGARVAGNLTVEPGEFNSFVSQIWVQDAAGDGIQIFDRTLLPIARGDQVQFVGSLEQFGGQTQLNISQPWGNFGHTLISAGSVPAPQVLTVAQVGEAVEGQLIRVNNVTVVDGQIPFTGSANLTITDNGGVDTLTLRVDSDTDIPGASTPTQTFDIIGIASQFDSFHPFTFGYQVLPRNRDDFISDEVNHSVVIISEIHADPDTTAGDANGDGTVSTSQDEFIELLNTGYTAVDLSGFTLADGVKVRHTFPAGTVIPPREAAVVFGGGTPTGDFGSATALGLVFTASTGSLGLNNSGDTVTFADDQGATLQSVTYGSEGGQNQSLVRSPDFNNAPFVQHTTADTVDQSRYSPGASIFGEAFTVAPGSILLSEVLYDASSSDNGFEWVELYNTTSETIDLSSMSLGQGGNDYTTSLVQLSGTIGPGQTFVVGGPSSDGTNGNPVFDLAIDFSPDFQNSGSTADGVALFNLPSAAVTATTVPVDAVVYGTSNDNNLIDETGLANPPEVGDAPAGSSVERTDVAGNWQIQGVPTPNSTPLSGGNPPPPPPAGDLVLSEVFYDASSGDDGFEWVELYNNGSTAIDLSNYSLGAGGSGYTTTTAQLSGTVQPGAVFVVGEPSSDGTNSNPTYDLVLNFSPDLQNSGSTADGVALFNLPAAQINATSVPVDAVVYGTTNSTGLIDETGVANAPEVGDAPSGSSIERTDLAGNWQVQATPTPNSSPLQGTPPPSGQGNVILSEVFYDASSGDNGFEWIELYNSGTASVDLSTFSLGAGGSDYTTTTVQLSGTIAPGATFVVGGPTSNASNGNPTFDLTINFSPDLQNSGSTADGVALFDVTASQITASTVPIDAVVYGGSNTSGLIDETGVVSAPEVGDAAAGSSIERTTVGGSWQIQSTPTPNSTSL